MTGSVCQTAPGQHLEKLEKLEKVEKNSQGEVRFSQGRVFSRSGPEIQRISRSFPKVHAGYFLKVGTRFLKVATYFLKVEFNLRQGRFGFPKLSITTTRSKDFTPQASLHFKRLSRDIYLSSSKRVSKVNKVGTKVS